MKLPDVISPPKPLWGLRYKMQGRPFLDHRGFLLSIATLDTPDNGAPMIYFRGRSMQSSRLPDELIEEYLAKVSASGPEGLEWAQRYMQNVVEGRVHGITIGQDPGEIHRVGPWNGRPLQLLLNPHVSDRLIIVDDEQFHVHSDIYGEFWQGSYPGSAFEFAEEPQE